MTLLAGEKTKRFMFNSHYGRIDDLKGCPDEAYPLKIKRRYSLQSLSGPKIFEHKFNSQYIYFFILQICAQSNFKVHQN